MPEPVLIEETLALLLRLAWLVIDRTVAARGLVTPGILSNEPGLAGEAGKDTLLALGPLGLGGV